MTLLSVTALIASYLPEPHAGLLSGILFGTKSSMDQDLYDNLVTTGTLHMVALSGANISILISLTERVLMGIMPMRKGYLAVLTVSIISGFVLFVGPTPPVLRAAVMGSITAIGIAVGRPVWSLWSWFMAVAVMVAFRPVLIWDISFQLSAGATIGIILFCPPLANRSGGTIARDLFWSNLYTTLSAQVFTLPLILFHFRRISLISPVPNILIAPVIPLMTGIGYAAVFIGSLWEPAGQPLAWVLWAPLQYMLWVVNITAKIPLASIGM